jgi:apolipoprotein N-acyltransferase
MNRVQRLLDRWGSWLALPAGAALSLAFAPTRLFALALLLPALLYFLWQGVSPRRAALRGLLFTGGTFLAGTYWLYNSIHLIGQAPLWIALFLMLGLVAIMGSYSAAQGYAAARWGIGDGPRRWMLLLPGGWVLVEWFRGWFMSGFPWLSLGYSQLDTPLRGYAPVLGIYGVSLAVAVCAGALLTLLIGTRRSRMIALAVAVLTWAGGYALSLVEWTQPTGRETSVALVQGAVPQSLKWEAGQRERTMQLYLALSQPYFGADIIVWPEVAIPALASSVRGFLDEVGAMAESRGSTLVSGLLNHDPETDAYYNAMAVLSREEQWYYKRRLVPFGEFFPVPEFVREWMRLMNLPYSDFESGSEQQPPLAVAGETLAPTICYEDAYGVEQLALARASTLLVNATNDAWFGDSTAPHQHLDISRMRSLETGRSMLRVANDGITALIGHDGAVLGQLEQFKASVLAGKVEPRTGNTPYMLWGNWPVLAIATLAVAGGLAWPRREPR